MSKCTTTEGHIVEVGKKYVARGGAFFEITEIIEEDNFPIKSGYHTWQSSGFCMNSCENVFDLMRPYEEAQSEPDKKEEPQFNTSNHWIDYSSKMQFSRPDAVGLEDLVDVEYTNGKREYASLTGGILWADVMKYRIAFSRKSYLKGVEGE